LNIGRVENLRCDLLSLRVPNEPETARFNVPVLIDSGSGLLLENLQHIVKPNLERYDRVFVYKRQSSRNSRLGSSGEIVPGKGPISLGFPGTPVGPPIVTLVCLCVPQHLRQRAELLGRDRQHHSPERVIRLLPVSIIKSASV